jgi:hypothetical protein
VLLHVAGEILNNLDPCLLLNKPIGCNLPQILLALVVEKGISKRDVEYLHRCNLLSAGSCPLPICTQRSVDAGDEEGIFFTMRPPRGTSQESGKL